ncbi:hypothetical protein HDU82_006121 [Entophlyctis luteolus]|nr:hypothetical protein HDU82_006121 [Entophlyctis luteolus]
MPAATTATATAKTAARATALALLLAIGGGGAGVRADSLYAPTDIAASALVTASSSSYTGACYVNKCLPSNVLSKQPNSTGQWVSAPGSCDSTRVESISLDWSANLGVQYLTEVRFQYGDYMGTVLIPGAASSSLVVFDSQPMNIPNPTAVTYMNSDNWFVYVFEVAVTATSITINFNNLTSPDDGVSCQVSLTGVQVWTGAGPSPDSLSGVPRTGMSAGALAGTVIGVLLGAGVICGVAFVLYQRRKNIRARFSQRPTLFELHGRPGGPGRRLEDDDEDRVPVVGADFEVLAKRVCSWKKKEVATGDASAGVPSAESVSTNGHADSDLPPYGQR